MPIPKIGYFGWRTYELAFDSLRVPYGGGDGEEGRAFYNIASRLEGARAHTAARSIGLAQGALEAAMAKLFAAEMSEQVTSEAMQILGGAGYTTLHAVERHWRDARLTKIFEGSSEIQQRIISDALLGKTNH